MPITWSDKPNDEECFVCEKPLKQYINVHRKNLLGRAVTERWCLKCVWTEGSDQFIEDENPKHVSEPDNKCDEGVEGCDGKHVEDDDIPIIEGRGVGIANSKDEKDKPKHKCSDLNCVCCNDDDEDLFDLEDLEGDFPTQDIKEGEIPEPPEELIYTKGSDGVDRLSVPGFTSIDKVEASGSNDGVMVTGYNANGSPIYSWNPFKSPFKGKIDDIKFYPNGVIEDPNPNNAKVKVDRPFMYNGVAWDEWTPKYTAEEWKGTVKDKCNCEECNRIVGRYIGHYPTQEGDTVKVEVGDIMPGNYYDTYYGKGNEDPT